MKTSAFLAIPLLAATSLAYPSQPTVAEIEKRYTQSDIAILKAIAPNSASCANAPFADECVAADSAVGPIIASFAEFNIITPGEQAALLAWMTFESGEFKYIKNHFPGTPGQGTRCMMMPNFVGEYAATIGVTTTDPAQRLAQVINHGSEWSACSWFYSTKCTAAVKAGLKTGSDAAFDAFTTQCVGTTSDPKRTAYWKAATKALGITA